MVESQVPVLEMLWEAQDPHHALDERFGFSDGQAAGRWVADTLNEHWGVPIDSCERIAERWAIRHGHLDHRSPAVVHQRPLRSSVRSVQAYAGGGEAQRVSLRRVVGAY